MAPAGMLGDDFTQLMYVIMLFLTIGAIFIIVLVFCVIRWSIRFFNDEKSLKEESSEELKKCPYCALNIKKECYFCEHCGKQVEND